MVLCKYNLRQDYGVQKIISQYLEYQNNDFSINIVIVRRRPLSFFQFGYSVTSCANFLLFYLGSSFLSLCLDSADYPCALPLLHTFQHFTCEICLNSFTGENFILYQHSYYCFQRYQMTCLIQDLCLNYGYWISFHTCLLVFFLHTARQNAATYVTWKC